MSIFSALSRKIAEISDRWRVQRMIKRLYSTPGERWLEIRDDFNKWKFPVGFYEFAPKWWGVPGKHNGERAMRIVSPVIDEISKVFNEKERLRYHNVVVGKMSDAEFEYWYYNIGLRPRLSSISESEYYYRQMKVRSLEWWKGNTFAMIDMGPKIYDFLEDLAEPKRGSEADGWDISDASKVAKTLLNKINIVEERLKTKNLYIV